LQRFNSEIVRLSGVNSKMESRMAMDFVVMNLDVSTMVSTRKIRNMDMGFVSLRILVQLTVNLKRVN
jgi:hypothetical protein